MRYCSQAWVEHFTCLTKMGVGSNLQVGVILRDYRYCDLVMLYLQYGFIPDGFSVSSFPLFSLPTVCSHFTNVVENLER